MKKDWTYKKLGEVCDILNGYAFKSNKYVDKGIRVIRIANVQKGVIVDDQPAFYPLSTQSEIDKYILNEGDILMSLTGNVGRVGILQKEMLPAALNQRVACLRMIDNSLYSKFFFHYLNSDLFEQKCIASARGIAQLNMSTEWLKEQFIPIPPLSIQHSIVAELDLLHSVISKKKEQLRELDNLAQSLFYQMFGDPITNPKQWEVKKLGELFDIGSSKRVYQSEWTTSGVPFYRAREVVKLARDGYVDNELFITEELYDKYAEKYGTPKVGDILVTAVGTLGVTYIVKEKDRFYYKDGNIICLHHKGAAVESKYVDFCFKTPFVREQIDNWSGATVGTFTIVKANTTILPLPPLSLQQSFAAKIEAIEAQKQAITQSIQHTEALLAQRMDQYFA